MTSSRWRLVKDLLSEAMDLPRAEREAYLHRAAGEDTELAREVESLLLASDDAGEFLDKPALEQQPDTTIGSRLGRYRILEEIGHGGMGAVYRAVRDDDEFQQEVAVKLTRHGLDTGYFRTRFLYERQLHAFLSHPNIARLVDGGTTADGRPYFVMELIDGNRSTSIACRRIFHSTTVLRSSCAPARQSNTLTAI